ncbi:hypothetical protein C8J56DRAFT_1044823 [Mycena floridula]|nr:hypothetical protein C8J56DRAFT_1044823 [Mycena floridula]
MVDADQQTILIYRSMALAAQTFVYGMYCMVMLVAFKEGLKTKVSRWLLALTLFMFLMSTASWYTSIANLVMIIKQGQDLTDLPFLFNALTLANYIIADGIVLWRAWVLCRDERRKTLFFGVFCFIVASIATTCIRITIMLTTSNDGVATLASWIEITQITTFCTSFMTNMVSTSVVSMKVWRRRRDIRMTLGTGLPVEKLMILLTESGLLYAFFGLLFLVSFFIHIPVADALGNLYAPVNAQLAGMYPLVVLLVVKQQNDIFGQGSGNQTTSDRAFNRRNARIFSGNDTIGSIWIRSSDSIWAQPEVSISPTR